MQSVGYIDGQNFLYKAAEHLISIGKISQKQELTKIDLPFLINTVLPENSNSRIFKYDGVTKIKRQKRFGLEIEQKSITFADNLRKLRNCLNSTGVEYRAIGTLLVRETDECKQCGQSNYKYQEKGVDVGMAVELVADSLKKRTQQVVLLSSDTDLIPALKVVKQEGIEIIYLAFEDQVTKAIAAHANATHVIRRSELIEAYDRANQ